MTRIWTLSDPISGREGKERKGQRQRLAEAGRGRQRALGDEGPKVNKSAAMHFVVLIAYILFNSSITVDETVGI